MNPIRFRGTVPVGRGGLAKPSIRQLTCMPPRVFLAMSRSACRTVSAFPALSCRIRSPPHWAGSRSSLGNDRHRRQARGLERGEAVPVVEQRRADAERHREPVRHHGRAEHARVRRRAADAGRRRRAARGQEPGPVGHRLEKVGQLGPAVGGGSRTTPPRWPACGAGRMPGLVRAVERHRRQPPSHDRRRWRRPSGSGPECRVGSTRRPRPPRPPATTPPATPPAMPRRNERRRAAPRQVPEPARRAERPGSVCGRGGRLGRLRMPLAVFLGSVIDAIGSEFLQRLAARRVDRCRAAAGGADTETHASVAGGAPSPAASAAGPGRSRPRAACG